MADTLTIQAIEDVSINGTVLSGVCQFPGDQSTHVLKVTILDNGNDVTNQYSIFGPTIDADGNWSATIQPTVMNLSFFSVEISCTHGNATSTTSLPMNQEIMN